MQIIWCCPVDPSGYSECGRDYVLALDSVGANIRFEPTKISTLIDGLGISNSDLEKLQRLSEVPKDEVYARVQHCVPDRFYLDTKARFNIGYTVCETEQIPKKWVAQCNRMDMILTASKFCRDVFVNNGVDVPVHIIPHCFDPEKWNDKVKPLNIVNNKHEHRFLFSGDITPRKGFDKLLEAWCKATSKNDNCSLTIKGYFNSFSEEDAMTLQEDIKARLQSYSTDYAKVLFYGNCISTELMPRFYKSFDTIISPSLGEGFGLIPFQCMAMGLSAIVTGGTGMLEYANEDNAFLIPVTGKQPVTSEMLHINPNFKGCEFLTIDDGCLVKHISDIINNKLTATIKQNANNAKIYFKRFGYEKIANLIIEKTSGNTAGFDNCYGKALKLNCAQSGKHAKVLWDEAINCKGLNGYMAEIGVSAGGSASIIASAVPDKELYIFDTFSGFPGELKKEDTTRLTRNNDVYKGFFNGTNYEQIQKNLAHCDNIKITQGVFPESGGIIKDKHFCFVHIDCDLYESTKNSLEFFKNKMINNGVIVVHDYHHKDWPGVTKAIDEFLKNNNSFALTEFPYGQCKLTNGGDNSG